MPTAIVASVDWFPAAALAGIMFVWIGVMTRARGRRLERRMTRELAGVHTPRSIADPVADGSATVATIHDPDAQLRITLDELLRQREILLQEFQEVQERIRRARVADLRRRRLMPIEDAPDVVLLHDPRTPGEARRDRG